MLVGVGVQVPPRTDHHTSRYTHDLRSERVVVRLRRTPRFKHPIAIKKIPLARVSHQRPMLPRLDSRGKCTVDHAIARVDSHELEGSVVGVARRQRVHKPCKAILRTHAVVHDVRPLQARPVPAEVTPERKCVRVLVRVADVELQVVVVPVEVRRVRPLLHDCTRVRHSRRHNVGYISPRAIILKAVLEVHQHLGARLHGCGRY